jgi:hypothetical protein
VLKRIFKHKNQLLEKAQVLINSLLKNIIRYFSSTENALNLALFKENIKITGAQKAEAGKVTLKSDFKIT